MGYPLTVEEFQAIVTTTASEELIQSLLDAAEATIDDVLGPPGGPVNELISARGELIRLSRPAASIEAVLEASRTLETTDYELRSGGRIVRRLKTGQWPYIRGWRGGIDITYTPVDDTDTRIAAQTALVRLGLDYKPGVTSERIGEWAETFAQGGMGYVQARDSILASLTDSTVGIY